MHATPPSTFPGTDRAYTLSDFDDPARLLEINYFLQAKDVNGRPLIERVLFGTDFFMTEQEKRESELYALAKSKLSVWFDQIARVNTQKFLM